MEVKRRDVGVATWRNGGLEAWSSGYALLTWGRGSVSSGGLEGRCRRADAEVRRYGALETRCRCNDMEVWRGAAGVATRRNGAVEVWRVFGCVATWRYEGLEARYRCSNEEVRRYGCREVVNATLQSILDGDC